MRQKVKGLLYFAKDSHEADEGFARDQDREKSHNQGGLLALTCHSEKAGGSHDQPTSLKCLAPSTGTRRLGNPT
jgi:hypothetical protein